MDPKANCATDLSRVCSSSGSSDLSSVSSSSSVPVTPGAANAGAAPNALVLSSTPTGGYPVSVLAPGGPSSRNGADAGSSTVLFTGHNLDDCAGSRMISCEPHS